eukprot:472331_1
MQHYCYDKRGNVMGYDILINERNVFLHRTKEYDFPIFAQSKIISFGLHNVSCIQLNEQPDWTKANLIGFGTGIGLGLISGYFGYYGLSKEYQMAKTIGFGITGYLSGFAAGFTFSLHKYRISTLDIILKDNNKFRITKPFNQNHIQDEIQNIKNFSSELNMNPNVDFKNVN